METSKIVGRMYQNAGLLHGDEIPVPTMTANDLDYKIFSEFYERQYEEPLDEQALPLEKIINNLNLGYVAKYC